MSPYSWTIDDASRTVFVRGHGDAVTADMLALIAELGRELRPRAGYDFVYNSVDLRIESSPADIMRVANAMFAEAGLHFRRFALVVPPARVPLAHIFSALAHPFGVTANVFADEDTALEWLAERRERAHIEARPSPDPAGSVPGDPPPSFPPLPEAEPEP